MQLQKYIIKHLIELTKIELYYSCDNALTLSQMLWLCFMIHKDTPDEQKKSSAVVIAVVVIVVIILVLLLGVGVWYMRRRKIVS